jgi:hypothetical protein
METPALFSLLFPRQRFNQEYLFFLILRRSVAERQVSKYSAPIINQATMVGKDEAQLRPHLTSDTNTNTAHHNHLTISAFSVSFILL